MSSGYGSRVDSWGRVDEATGLVTVTTVVLEDGRFQPRETGRVDKRNVGHENHVTSD